MTHETAMSEPIRHPICRECQTVAHCAANGCIPISEYDEFTEPARESAAEVILWLIGGGALAVIVTFLLTGIWPLLTAAFN